MTELKPLEATNLGDLYGTAPLAWERALAAITSAPAGPGHSWFLGTVRPDGRPHAAAIGIVWHDGAIHFTTGPKTQKTRNLLGDPRCTVSTGLEGLDAVFEGEAERVTDPAVLEAVTARYRAIGWPVEVDGDVVTAPFSAPSAGPAPWHMYRVTIHSVVGVATAEPHGVMKWRFR